MAHSAPPADSARKALRWENGFVQDKKNPARKRGSRGLGGGSAPEYGEGRGPAQQGMGRANTQCLRSTHRTVQ